MTQSFVPTSVSWHQVTFLHLLTTLIDHSYWLLFGIHIKINLSNICAVTLCQAPWKPALIRFIRSGMKIWAILRMACAVVEKWRGIFYPFFLSFLNCIIAIAIGHTRTQQYRNCGHRMSFVWQMFVVLANNSSICKQATTVIVMFRGIHPHPHIRLQIKTAHPESFRFQTYSSCDTCLTQNARVVVNLSESHLLTCNIVITKSQFSK